jgi:protein phosphatase
MSATMPIPHAALTDVGQRRDHNEDAYHVAPPVLVVADGVGGSAKGEVASSLAIEHFVQAADDVAAAGSSTDAARAMERAVLAANDAVHQSQLADETRRGMATTIVAAVVRDGGEIVVGHVGDSRLYVLGATGARQVTEDHTVVNELVRTGRITAEDAAHHPQRNVITRALGTDSDVSVDSFIIHAGPGDWLLACSDGLTEHVADGELARAVLEHPHDPDGAVRWLVDLANERGGSDNITVIIAQPVPSDVSGELSIEALHAAAATTSQITKPVASEAPAQDSGPMPLVAAHPAAAPATAAETSGELPRLEPVPHDDEWTEPRHGHRRRGWFVFGTLVVLAAIAGGFLWSQSYFLIEREDGSVGINRGFPFARLATPYRSSDVVAEQLSDADRERLVESHRILSREDAERVLDELPSQLESPTGGV